MRIGALQLHNVKAGKIKVGVHAAGGHLEMAPLSASLYEGALNGTARADADANRVAANATLDGISIGPLLKDLDGQGPGRGAWRRETECRGGRRDGRRDAPIPRRGASLALRDGAVHGINIVQRLRDVKSALSGGSTQIQAASSADKTDFSS